MKQKYINENKGFTMIELLVVISVITLLSSIALVTFRNVRFTAIDTKHVQQFQALATALDLYYQDNGSYPYFPSSPCTPVMATPPAPGQPACVIDNWTTLSNSLSPYADISHFGGNDFWMVYLSHPEGINPMCGSHHLNLGLNAYWMYAALGLTNFTSNPNNQFVNHDSPAAVTLSSSDGGVSSTMYESYGGSNITKDYTDGGC